MYKGELYLTSCNYGGLYKMDVNSGKIKKIFDFPRNMRRMKFVSIIVEKDFFIFLPWSETSVYIYDFKNTVLHEYRLKNSDSFTVTERKYEKKLLIKENEIHAYMPKQKERTVIILDGDKFSFVRKGDFDDEEKREIGIQWKESTKGPVYYRLCCVDGKTYYTPLFKNEAITIIDDSGEKKEIHLPDDIWIESEIQFAFWYVEVIGRYIFFLPHEAKGIPYIDRVTGELSIAYIPVDGYCSLRRDVCVDINDIYECESGYIAVSFQGNCIVKLDTEGKYESTINICVDEKTYTDYLMCREVNIEKESEEYSLNDFLDCYINNIRLVKHIKY